MENNESKEIERLNLLIKKIKRCLEVKKNNCRVAMVNSPVPKHSLSSIRMPDLNQWEFNFCDEMLKWIEGEENEQNNRRD